MTTEEFLTPKRILEINLGATDPQEVMDPNEALISAVVSTLYDTRVLDLVGTFTPEHLGLLEQHIKSLKEEGDLQKAEKLSNLLNNKYNPISPEI